MKKPIRSLISKLTLGVLFFVAVIAVQAQPTDVPNEKTSGVKYLGVQGDMVLFNVLFDNPTGTKFSVILRDQNKDVLFQDTYTDKKFDKKFKVPTSEKNKITFIIKNYKDADLVQSFEINVNTRFIEDVAVKKLN